MVALATVLSFAKIDYPHGGGPTICSMVPIVIVSFMYGPSWGISTAFVYSVFQLIFGLDNVQYATSTAMALLIVLFDYIIAYTVVGLAGFFRDEKRSPKRVILAATTVLILRFVCHFITGVFVWDALWPNEFELSSALYSLLYNGSYMLPEIIITAVVSYILCSSKQFNTFISKSSKDTLNSKSDNKSVLVIGITLIALQIAAYVASASMKTLVFFSADETLFSNILHVCSYNLVGIIGIVFTVCGAVIKKKK